VAVWCRHRSHSAHQRVGNAINKGMAKIKPEGIKVEEDESGCDILPRFGIQTIRYTVTVTGRTKMSSSVYMITCLQKNLMRLQRLLTMVKGNYFACGFNEFVSTKVMQEQHWNKLGEHIEFYSSKNTSLLPGKDSPMQQNLQHYLNQSPTSGKQCC
jgi:hypothetical protein